MIKRIENFKKMGLGLFIHYGLYSKFEKGEWYWEMNHLNENQYFELVGKDFELKSNFNKIIPFIKEAGFNYAVLTSKHHDGFALYDSNGISKYDINWLGNSIDIIDSFIIECKKNNVKPFLYYATMEWIKKPFKEQVKNIYKNIEYLITKYKKDISGFWFDGNWSDLNNDWELDNLYSMIREHNSECIIINNTGLEAKGELSHAEIDAVTFEQGKKINDVSFTEKEIAFEVCYPTNDHWGNAKNDFNFKSFSDILNDFVNIRSEKGNLLLNIGLDKNGEISSYEYAIIELLKKWNVLNEYCLNGNIEILKQQNDELIFVRNKSNAKDYILVKNLNSGAHIDNIHYGNIAKKLITNINLCSINKIKFLDNNSKINFCQKENSIELEINSFEYGTNEIIRVMEIVYNV